MLRFTVIFNQQQMSLVHGFCLLHIFNTTQKSPDVLEQIRNYMTHVADHKCVLHNVMKY